MQRQNFDELKFASAEIQCRRFDGINLASSDKCSVINMMALNLHQLKCSVS